MGFEKQLSWRRCLALVLVGAWNAEAVSMGTFPYEFLHPANIFVTFMYYALQLLIIEDLYSRFKLSYRDLFLIGILFGLLEEGVLTLTFYIPVTEWLKPGYGRILGINTVWATFLTFFHATYTVTLTFLIIDRFFPRNRGPLLNRRAYALILSYLLVLYIGNPIHVAFTVMPSQLHFNFKPKIEAILIVAFLIVILMFTVASRIRKSSYRSYTTVSLPQQSINQRALISDACIILLMSAAWFLPYMHNYEGFPETIALLYSVSLATLGPLAFSWYLKRSGGVNEKRLTIITASLVSFYMSLSVYCYFLSHDYISMFIIAVTFILELELVFKRPLLLSSPSLIRKTISLLKVNRGKNKRKPLTNRDNRASQPPNS
ncbi:MAG: hypothetical protein QXX18_10675 [Candidatus Jordarchaeales archaeon]